MNTYTHFTYRMHCTFKLRPMYYMYITHSHAGPTQDDSDSFTHELRGIIPRGFEYLFNLINREIEKVERWRSTSIENYTDSHAIWSEAGLNIRLDISLSLPLSPSPSLSLPLSLFLPLSLSLSPSLSVW